MARLLAPLHLMAPLRLRSRSPASDERTALLLAQQDDLESGSGSGEDCSDSSSSTAALQLPAPWKTAALGCAQGALVALLAIGWMIIFHDKICGVVSHCGW